MFRRMIMTCTLAFALVMASMLPVAATTATAPCPRGADAVIDVEYVLFHSDGSSNDVSTLDGNVRLGDTVNALFNVPALPSGCPQVQLSLASYSSGSPSVRKQRLFSSDTGEFLPGGRYEMSVTVAPPPSPDGPRVIFRLAFATGPVLTRPSYGPDLIASAKA